MRALIRKPQGDAFLPIDTTRGLSATGAVNCEGKVNLDGPNAIWENDTATLTYATDGREQRWLVG